MAANNDQSEIVNASGWRAVIKRWRRDSRRRLNHLLTRLFGTTEPRRRPLAEDTRTILVVRLNKRLGNILFLTPMLRTLAATLPAASIDVLIQDPEQKPLLESLPSIRQVFVQDKTLAGMLRLVRRIRRQRYDLTIDPSGNSTSNRLAVALCGARQRMGFASRDQWLRLTHAAPRADSRHQALQAVELLTNAVSGLDFDVCDTLAVYPDANAQAATHLQWQQALGSEPPPGPVIGFFAQATGQKQMPDDWWPAWRARAQEILPDATFLQICPPGTEAGIAPDIAQVAIRPLDELAALLSRLHVFVAADSGPMHLAAAAGVPVVGLFRATSSTSYAPLGHDCVSLSDQTLTRDEAARAVERIVTEQRRRNVA